MVDVGVAGWQMATLVEDCAVGDNGGNGLWFILAVLGVGVLWNIDSM
jgi:hypothetical protein